ncbi:MAG: hypothetical protein HWN80_04660 [Candidatus Lokiarchaeota archaeon]|nr:hypothetical protein [Candidatus Lokiarchaeota archaeon]
MVKSYGNLLKESNNWKGKSNSGKESDGDDLEKAYLKVWKVNPSYKDVDKRETLLKVGSLTIIGFLYFAFLLSATFNFTLSITLTLIVVISFVLVFHKNIFGLKHLFELRHFEPFQELVFWQPNYDTSLLFFTNHKDLITTGIRTFRITVIPENVHANLNRFIKGLHAVKVPYSYQIIQKPLQLATDSNTQNQISSFETMIFFSTFYCVKGRVSKSKLLELVDNLREYTVSLKSAFASNFHHFRITELTGTELVNAFRSSVLKQEIVVENDSNNITSKSINQEISISIIKAIYILSIVVSLDLLLSIFNLPLGIRLLLSFVILISIIAVWWRELLFQFNKGKFFKSKDIEVVDPFSNVQFYKSSKTPESIFYQVEGSIIGGLKMFNINFTYPPSYCTPDKFYEALIRYGMPFTVTFQLKPLSFNQFDKEGFKYLKEGEKMMLLSRTDNFIDGNNWLSSRAGIWSIIATYSTSVVFNSPDINYELIDTMEQKLKLQKTVLHNTFKQFFTNYEILSLRKNKLEAGFMFETLKNKFFLRNGTHLSYVLYQGKTLRYLAAISDQFKKGIETKLATEFNTPLQLTNYITVGKTINTEFLESEVPAGFLLEHLHNLLLTNGTTSNRELLTQKIVVELVKKGQNSVVFDFTGSWSRVMNYFKGTVYENQFIYHKLGKTFLINPLRSGIPYDTDNPGYLDYMLDAYAMCFKKDERTIETFKNTILRNPDIDVSTLVLDLTTMREWEKSTVTDTLLSFFKEFTPQESSFIHHQQQDSQDTALAYEFITNDKTVIIDLSEVKDYDKQCYFAFVVISKFIHYLRTGKPHISKFIIMPHVDIIFDGFFLDKRIQYGKIDKFFDPLVENKFGTIYSASQIRYLHPNVFNYLSNIVTFRATDKRDMAVLNGQMNLESLHGVGYYSTSRNEGYQARFIGNMKPDEAVLKRGDIYQTFPVKFDLEELRGIKPLAWEEIVIYMQNLGYDLEKTERKIMKRAQTTLFESDFAGYSNLIEGTIKFLNNLQVVDKVGNMYKKKVKEELQKVLHPYILKVTKDRKREKDMISDIFGILVKQQYLVENHPRRASGSESMQTSFAVGPHYQKVLKDYYESRESSAIAYEPIELESDKPTQTGTTNIIKLKIVNLKRAITEHFAPILYYEFFNIHKFIDQHKYEKALKIAKKLLRKFLYNVYNSYYSVNYAITSIDIQNFIKFMTSVEGFPFLETELTDFLSMCDNISLEKNNLEHQSKEVFKSYSKLFNTIKSYIEGDLEGI